MDSCQDMQKLIWDLEGKEYTGGGSQIILANKYNHSWTADGANVSGYFGEISKGNVAGWNMSWRDWEESGGWFDDDSDVLFVFRFVCIQVCMYSGLYVIQVCM